MIVLASTIIGILFGVRGATKRGGQRLDKLQWGAAYGIAFALLGLFATIALERLLA